jgi:hypothetical protein
MGVDAHPKIPYYFSMLLTRFKTSQNRILGNLLAITTIASFSFSQAACTPRIFKNLSLKSNTPTITAVEPNWLSRQGGEEVYISGDFSKFSSHTVTIDDQSCTSVTKLSDTEIRCISPANSQIKTTQLKINYLGDTVASTKVQYVGVLGQESTTRIQQYARGLNQPCGMKIINSKLYIADNSNYRIVGFNNLSNIANRDFDFAFGVPNKNLVNTSENVLGIAGDEGNYYVRDMDYDPTTNTFAIPDRFRHRVLLYDGIPTKWNQKPKVILGQPDGESKTPNNGGISAKSLLNPYSAKFIDGKLFVADWSNNRVLGWNSIPTTNFQAADFVLGQPNFTTNSANTGGRSASSMYQPLIIEKIGSKFFVSDYGNGRILIWNSVPSTTQAPANEVIGQANFTSSSGIPSATTTISPIWMKYHAASNTFLVTDSSAYRVLVYRNFDPSASLTGKAADYVIGQPLLTSTAAMQVDAQNRITSQSLNLPCAVEVDDQNRVLIADQNNHRILIYNQIPTENNPVPDEIIGQDYFTQRYANRGTGMANSLVTPNSVILHGTKLVIPTQGNHNVMVWNSIPTTDNQNADFVLGQDGFGEHHNYPNRTQSLLTNGSTTADPTASSLYTPTYAESSNGKLIISELSNNRVLIWNSLTGSSGQAADVVVGQTDFLSRTATTAGAATLFRLNAPPTTLIHNGKMIVADRGSHRMTIYNSIPTTNGVAADSVIGQSNFSDTLLNGNTNNTTPANGTQLNDPTQMVMWQDRFVLSDQGNRRVLVWTTIDDFLNGQQPAYLWGQDGFSSNATQLSTFGIADTLGINRSHRHIKVNVVDGILLITDLFNGRILVFKDAPTGTVMVPSAVIGQKDFNSRDRVLTARNYSASTILYPYYATKIDGKIFLSESHTNRVLILPGDVFE